MSLTILTRTYRPDAPDGGPGRLTLGDPPAGTPPCASCTAGANVELDLDELGTHTLCTSCLVGLVSFAVDQLDPFG